MAEGGASATPDSELCHQDDKDRLFVSLAELSLMSLLATLLKLPSELPFSFHRNSGNQKSDLELENIGVDDGRRHNVRCCVGTSLCPDDRCALPS